MPTSLCERLTARSHYGDLNRRRDFCLGAVRGQFCLSGSGAITVGYSEDWLPK